MMEENNILQLKHVSKKYSGSYVLKDVDFCLGRNQIHAVVGENGAGKSTLIKIISGVVRPESGAEIYVDNKRVVNLSPAAMLKQGITVMYQEISLFCNMTAAENICMDHSLGGLVRRENMQKEARELLEGMGCDWIDVSAECENLSAANQQMVLLARAVYFKSRIIIMDEPTSALSENEIRLLYKTMRQLKREASIIYISHKLNEVYEIADKITVLRDGEIVASDKSENLPHQKLIELIIGKKLELQSGGSVSRKSEKVFEVREFCRKNKYHNINISVCRGEILGITGLVGAGRTELALGIIGAQKPDKGTVLLDKEEIVIRDIKDSIEKEICYLTEDRRKLGLFYDKSIEQNITASGLKKFVRRFRIDKYQEKLLTEQFMRKIQIKASGRMEHISSLSGGNQQKVLLGKWIHPNPKVLIVDEPTAGVDIGSKHEIYKILRELSAQGIAIVVITSDINEVLTISDRVAVMNKGEIVYMKERDEIIQDEMLEKIIAGQKDE